MISGKIQYEFNSDVWQYSSPKGGWFFVSLPEELSKEIRTYLGWQEEGWGRLKITAKINDFQWNTSIWFDTKLNKYLLPLNATVRKKNQIQIGNKIDVILSI